MLNNVTGQHNMECKFEMQCLFVTHVLVINVILCVFCMYTKLHPLAKTSNNLIEFKAAVQLMNLELI